MVFSGTRQWVVPLKISGRFSGYHKVSSAVLFAILGVVPWLRWGGDPLFLADLGTRRLTVLGHVFTASDGVLIMLSALTAAFALFFFTSLYGRLWCGYACPQSVFMLNLVFPIEEWLEGPRSQRLKDAKAPLRGARLARRLAKWGLYLALAVLISMSFMGFFVRTEVLWTGAASATAYGVVGFFTFLWFWDFAWYREQTCNYICPYARFQGALTDDHSLTISYDVPRGEPRGKAAKARGGCIDCNKCVVVCPQGIDIRNGFQLECIACGKCIDACESVMSKLGHPTLVRYSTAAQDEGRQVALIRPRTVAYTGLLTALAAGFAVVLLNHAPLELMVDRMPGSLFIADDDGYVRNTYYVNVSDRGAVEGDEGVFVVTVDGLPEGAQVRTQPVKLPAEGRVKVPLIVRVPRASAASMLPLVVHVRGKDVEVAHKTTFTGPGIAANGEG